jgi:hypothetical protein
VTGLATTGFTPGCLSNHTRHFLPNHMYSFCVYTRLGVPDFRLHACGKCSLSRHLFFYLLLTNIAFTAVPLQLCCYISRLNAETTFYCKWTSVLVLEYKAQARIQRYIYLLRRGDSSIGIGKTTRHHEFNNDEICFCLVLRNFCPEKN